jgi:hypothetical protein
VDMELEVGGRMTFMFHAMKSQDRGRHYQEGNSDRTAIRDLLLGHRLAEEVRRRGALPDVGGGVQATVLIVATVEAEAGRGLGQEVEADMGGGEIVRQRVHVTASVRINHGVS